MKQFESDLDTAYYELENMTELLRSAWRFGDECHWSVDQFEGQICFYFADGRVVTALVQIVAGCPVQDTK